jgi:hypothetical protein
VAEIARYTRYRSTPDVPPSTAFPREHVLYYPLLDLKLRKEELTTPTLKVLIDSGAAYCIFGSDTATLLHIDVHSGKLKQDIYGLGGGSVDLYFFDIELVMNSMTIQCYAGFMDQEFPGNGVWIGLLGEYDFLSKTPVAFDAEKLQIRIG